MSPKTNPPLAAEIPELRGEWPIFADILRSRGQTFERRKLTTLQVNVGRLCNQACHHCHVAAGPNGTEVMARATADRIVELLAAPGGTGVTTVDLTGGAPELNPSFRFLVSACRELGKRVIDRCNLTVLLLPGQEDTVDFLAEHAVEIVASLPCYTRENVARAMCRDLLSVGWNGALYDCDFNQMLSLPAGGRPRTIWDIESLAELDEGLIATGDHCFGCTAGTGSSCSGSLQ